MLDADVVQAMSTPSIAERDLETIPNPYSTPSNYTTSSTPYTRMGDTPYSGMGGGVIRPAQASSYRHARMSGTARWLSLRPAARLSSEIGCLSSASPVPLGRGWPRAGRSSGQP